MTRWLLTVNPIKYWGDMFLRTTIECYTEGEADKIRKGSKFPYIKSKVTVKIERKS